MTLLLIPTYNLQVHNDTAGKLNFLLIDVTVSRIFAAIRQCNACIIGRSIHFVLIHFPPRDSETETTKLHRLLFIRSQKPLIGINLSIIELTNYLVVNFTLKDNLRPRFALNTWQGRTTDRATTIFWMMTSLDYFCL